MSSECPTNDMKLIIGYTTREHLILDLDNTSLHHVLGLANILMNEYPEIGNILIMRSSKQEKEYGTRIDRHGIPRHNFRKECFHLITDNIIGYNRCVHIINTLVDLGILETAYRRIRMFRGDMTLRVSPMILSTGIKAAPEPIICIIRHKKRSEISGILEYLAFWRSCRRVFLSGLAHLVTA